jgi:hypothetical protein
VWKGAGKNGGESGAISPAYFGSAEKKTATALIANSPIPKTAHACLFKKAFIPPRKTVLRRNL